MNRFQKVPAIIDNDGFKLAESIAIYHYLGRKEIISERWYPRDVKARARIEEYLEWNHNNLLYGAGLLFAMRWVMKLDAGEKQVKTQEKILIRALNDLENIWLTDNKYLAGNEITFADLMAACNLEQVVGMKIFLLDADKYPKISKWFNEVRLFFGDHFKEAHHFVYKYGARN